tara:strand:+ start:220 stop:456 length:237 start_codon:yes stop_codon:yes gene_type:complete
VPLGRTQWNLGKPFACADCNRTIVIPRWNGVMGFGLFVIFWSFRHHFPDQWGGPIGLFILMILLGIPMSWALTRGKLP